MSISPQRNDAWRREAIREDAIARSFIARRAQEDVNVFIPYVFGVQQQPIHREWQNDANEHPLITIDAPIEHGKTFQFSQARPLWKLGRDPHRNYAIISNTGELPESCLAVIASHIQYNERLREVFPRLEIERLTNNRMWLRTGSFRRDRDPSIVALGVEGNIVGRRLTDIDSDDIQDFQNTWTEHERRKLWTRIESQLLNRLIQDGTHTDIGTPWQVEDARAQLRRMFGYYYKRYDALDGLWPSIYVDPQTGKKYGWPRERLEAKRAAMSALEFDRQFRCIAISGSMAIFKQSDIEICKIAGRGLGFPIAALREDVVVTGIDLAVSKQATADETVMFTGTVRKIGDRVRKLPLDVRGGRWEVLAILRNMLYIVRAYPNHWGFRIENNAAQDYLLQVARNDDMMRSVGWTDIDLGRLRIVSHTTTASNKHDYVIGVRGMSADIEQARWCFPCDETLRVAPAMQRVLDGLVAFDPIGHTSDYVMAMWLFSEQIRRFDVDADANMFARYGVG